MEFKNRVEVSFPKMDKCHLLCDSDCPMGQIYDYSCALKSFAIQRMQEEEAKKEEKIEIQTAVE